MSETTTLIETSELSNDPIEGVEQVYKDVGQVLRPGTYHVVLQNPAGITFKSGRNKKGKPFTNLRNLSFQVVAGKTPDEVEGIQTGMTLRFQNSWIETIVRCILNEDALDEGLAPVSEAAQAVFLNQISTDETPFKIKVDWEAFNTELYNSELIRLAQTQDRSDPLEMAKQLATDDQTDEAGATATVAKSYTDFPTNAKTGALIAFKDGVRARPFIKHYFLAE